MSFNVNIAFGAMSPKIAEQLIRQGFKFDAKDIEHFQKDADAIVRLRIRDLLPAGQVEKCYQKLVKKITFHVAKYVNTES